MSQASTIYNFPYLTLPKIPKVIYCSDAQSCSHICTKILEDLVYPTAVGFDMEWRPNQKKFIENKTAVIQICTQPEKQCYVFHVSKMNSMPSMLKKLIENPDITKTGVGIQQDLRKLHQDFDFDLSAMRKSHTDLNIFAKSLSFKNKGNWSMRTLTETLLNKTIDKSSSLQRSNWEQYPLTEKQLEYAALDAYVGLILYEDLLKKKNIIF